MNLPLVLSVALSLAPQPAPAAVPSTSSEVDAVERVAIEVDHEALLGKQMAPAADKSKLFVSEDVAKALAERHGLEVVTAADAPAIIVTLAWKDYENSIYRIEVATRRPGQEPELVEAFEANCINNSALSDVVLERLPAALEQLVEPVEPATEVGEVTAPKDPPAAADEPADNSEGGDESTRAKVLGPVGVAGIVTGVTGVVLTGVGFGLAAREPSQMVDPCESRRRSSGDRDARSTPGRG